MAIKNKISATVKATKATSADHKFKPGTSGNPSGRPKGGFNFKKQLALIATGNATLSCEYGDIPLSPRFISVLKAVNAAMHNKLDVLQKLLPNLDIKIKNNGVNDD